MKSKLFIFIFSFTMFSTVYAGISATPAKSESKLKTDTFLVEKMTCKMCHITIKMAIEKVEGVVSAKVDYETKTATVNYNPEVATPKDIELASTNAGYPAKLQPENNE